MLAPRRVFVLLINAGTENEGIHTIQMGGQNKILMFEDEEDAARYALLLEAQDFPTPSVEEFPAEEIEEFCQEAGYDFELVESGRLEIPPEANVDHPTTALDETTKPTPPTEDVPERERAGEMSDAELEAQRRFLEGLL
ncbi:DUF3110 domain-containing protein [Spirulina major CS-329]|uniref:DUF3110 domain-containing protein n=1 Tax=Spirulina TaxID=1154 RepID=UPI00232D6174|nr:MULTISPECIES: DUF3110 domain-containing protein [Spirulina]MDB9493492.1 DUF3110 domain-containing protein [Spirulina subsalsa CS-330]MDB9502585.1 DUF3110 domain-containing protein [Spirulina major CS-329]